MQKKNKKGISLIVIVITIIVMMLLVAAVMLTLSNNGIINKANEAVDKTNEKQVQEIANMAWQDAYADSEKNTEEELLEELKNSVKKVLLDNGLENTYTPYVTTTGVEILKGKGWLQTSDKHVIKGDTVLEIGSDISYDETCNGTVTVEKNVNWKVLGAENGELLIMSASNIKDGYVISGKTGYENGVSDLNSMCESYGKGEYAIKARSIKVEDIDKLTGYDKTTYGEGKICKYGNIITYTYNVTTKPSYKGTNGVSGDLTSAHSNGFQWYDLDNVYHIVSASDLTNENNNGKEIGKVKSTYYYYIASSIPNLKEKSQSTYNMLFGSNDKNAYWLASSYINAYLDRDYLGLRMVYNGMVSGYSFLQSKGDGNNIAVGVRAVVYLSQDYNI